MRKEGFFRGKVPVAVEVEHPNGRRQFVKRALMSVGAVAALAATGACSFSKNGNVTTITVNIAKVKAYGQAGINAVSTVLSIAAVASAIGAPAVAVIETASVALSSALTAFASAAGSSVTVSYDDSTMKSAINSVLADLQTVLSVFEGLLGIVSISDARMTEAQALRVLRVTL